jgi:D-alanyl-D-alanine carboxypeptidase (penicillin-binding protein 5/6)
VLRRVVALAAVLAACLAHAAEDRFPKVAEAYLVKRDDRLLWAGGADTRLPLASLAKMMTALLALERGRLDEVVTVGRGALQATGTRIGLRPGEKLRARHLLAATVVRSANDACRALADHVGETTAGFVAIMNRRAASMGMANAAADPAVTTATGSIRRLGSCASPSR